MHYTYGDSGSTADAINRIDAIRDDDSGPPGDTLAQYSYLGAGPPLPPAGEGWGEGSIIQVDYPEPNLRYDLAHGTGDDPYDGLDRFGRVVDLLWRDYGSSTDAVRIKHGYDRAGNRLWREAPVAASYGKNFDELYSYDGMYQLATMQRGDLNAIKDAIVGGTKTFAEDWSLDPTGNWSTYKQDDDGEGTWDLDQDRTHNQVNEITQIDSSSTHVAHDRNGNMTRAPKPDDWSAHYDLTYDAWNRLVKVEDGANTVAEYEYDGRNFRIKKAVSGTTRHLCYTELSQISVGFWVCKEDGVPCKLRGARRGKDTREEQGGPRRCLRSSSRWSRSCKPSRRFFAQPSFRTHFQVFLGWIMCLGRRTEYGVFQAIRSDAPISRMRRHPFDRFYNFFSRSAWTVHDLAYHVAVTTVLRLNPRGRLYLVKDLVCLRSRRR